MGEKDWREVGSDLMLVSLIDSHFYGQLMIVSCSTNPTTLTVPTPSSHFFLPPSVYVERENGGRRGTRTLRGLLSTDIAGQGLQKIFPTVSPVIPPEMSEERSSLSPMPTEKAGRSL